MIGLLLPSSIPATLSLSALLIFCIHPGVDGVSITSIKVPPAVENGSAPVVLDCEYSLAGPEKQGLVVQWFFRDHPVPVYQWIPGKRPQDNGPLKGRLNLEYRASEDPYQRHRALEIVKPSIELGGEYRCKVATFDNEDAAQANMVVFVPAETFVIGKSKPTTSTLNVTCRVEGIYPEPQLELLLEDGPHGNNRMAIKASTLRTSKRDDGRFDSILYSLLEDRDLPDDATFECLLSLPGTEYQITQKLSYQPGAPVVSAGPLPSPENDIHDPREEEEHTWVRGTSVPASISAPHRSRDSDSAPAEAKDHTGDDEHGAGRGIRAHETITDNGADLHSHPRLSSLLLVTTIVIKYLG